MTADLGIIITGIVGVAGIGGTLLAARMTIRAERQRTMLADKGYIPIAS